MTMTSDNDCNDNDYRDHDDIAHLIDRNLQIFSATVFFLQHDQFCENTVLVAKEEEADEGGEQGRRCPCREASSTTTRESPQKS